MICAIATGPNAIPVSLERGNHLLNTVEENKTSDEVVQRTQPPSETRLESGPVPMRSEEAPCEKTDSSGKFAEAKEEDCRPEGIETMPHWWRETSAKECCNQGGALCYMGATASDELRTSVNGQWCELPAVRTGEERLQCNSHIVAPPRTPAEQAYNILTKQVEGMSAEGAAILLRPPPKRYKSHAKTKAKARITALVRQAAADAKNLRAPLHGLHYILALRDAGLSVALRFTEKWQGDLCCALIGNRPKASGSSRPLTSTALTTAEDEEESPWPTAKLEHDEWINSTQAQAIPLEITKVLKEYREVFPDNLPKGLPPKRPRDHYIPLVPGKLPICSPTITADKRDDGSGERKMCVVVTYQAMNALTVAPDIPLPPIQTILQMLEGAKYFFFGP
ncbi:Reverse transcriptase, related [Eimeria necatrix]|uniref:Reverse transcriptase, related n=1 Tax=Eimeria necatrix TaxID=51315 RepID=U6N7E6_9EIME|nr:Reverse transcriptase, related [Eimeria necatrix]CDJ69821.1 Reverse transcriptase, related [Eimeria necatrix]